MVCDSLSSDPACVKKRGLKFLTGRILIGSLNNSMLKLSSRQRTSEEVSRQVRYCPVSLYPLIAFLTKMFDCQLNVDG